MNYQYNQIPKDENQPYKISWDKIILCIIFILIIIFIFILFKNVLTPTEQIVLSGGGINPASEIRLTAISALENF